MRSKKSGFTLVEVSLFLALTALVFVGIAIGTSNSIFQQRYNDSVQNYVEFLRTIYSQVTNVQSESNGRSEKVIYGKLVTFEASGGENKIRVYNLIGNLENSATGSVGSTVLEKLKNLDANVVVEEDKVGGGKTYKTVGFVDDYVPKWSSQIQTTKGWIENGYKYSIYTGMLLIVRSPSSGTVYTYVSNASPLDYDGMIGNLNSGLGSLSGLSLDGFEQKDIDFCVNPNGASKSDLRKDVRIVKGARNASGIEIVSDDENRCGS